MRIILFKNRRLKKAEYALNQNRNQEAFKLGHTLVNSRNNEMASRANRICGLALYKRKKYDDSLEFLEKTCQLANYRHDWYNLTMASVYAAKLEKSEEAFQNIYRTNVQPGYMYSVPIPGLIFQYLRALKQKQFIDAAITRANELKQMYIGVGHDTRKQAQRGLPSYHVFIKEVESLFQAERFVEWQKTLKP